MARRSREEIQEVSASSLTPWSRPFCPSCSMDKEAVQDADNNNTLVRVARKKTSNKTREENPGTAREAGEAADVRTTLPTTAREEMTPDEATESTLMTKRQLTRERPRPSSPPSPWIPSDRPPSTPPSTQTTEEAERTEPDEHAESGLVIQ